MAKNNNSDVIVDNLKGFIRKGAATTPVGYVPTGHFSLDFAINYGELPEKIDLSELEGYDPSNALGIPLGKLVMLYGHEGGGKSSLAYRIAGFAQKLGHPVAWLDTEHSFAENLAIINGVDIDNIYYSTMSNPGDPDKVYFAEDVFDAMLELIKSGVKVIVLDSVANLVTKDRMEAGAEKIIIGKLARLMSENLGKLVAYADKYGCLLLFINQLRYKIGKLFGNPETTPGGMSLKHNSSLIIKITKKNSKEALIEVPGEDGKTKVIGRKSYMRLEKNRFAKPCMDSVEVPIYYTSYFPDVEEIMFEAGRQLKVISVRKGLFKWTDSKDEKHEIEGRSDFVAHIKYNELQYLLAKDLVVAAEENSTILPPEVSKWLNDYELTKKENDEKQPAKKKADGDRKTKSTEAVD